MTLKGKGPMTEPIGVILLNLGGPDRLEDVEPFLYNLFSDRQIIRLGPAFLQKPLARWIAARRAEKSRAAYRQIGGGSPLARITLAQGQALAARLAGQGPFQVCMAMRYWKPYAGEALAQLHDAGIKKIIALPLYPHYSKATAGSSLEQLRRVAARFPAAVEIAEISSWPVQPAYIDCLAAAVKSGLGRFGGERVELIYSAHSLPVKFIEEGDPYLDHLKMTVAALEKSTALKGRLCFQSRSGPVEWLTPSTPAILEQLAREGCRNVLAVPISFVSDHVETLYEIDILYREMAASLGMRLERTASLNVQPEFIKALEDLVLEAAAQRGW